MGVRRLQRADGSTDAVTVMVVEHAAEVHRYVSRLTAGDRQLTEDLVQSVFLTLVRHAERGHVEELGIAWLISVARSRFVDHVRSIAVRQRSELALSVRAVAAAAESAAPDLAAVDADRARWMLRQLPELERCALALAVVDGMPPAEVARVLGKSLDATHSLLARARRRLRLTMEGLPDDDR